MNIVPIRALKTALWLGGKVHELGEYCNFSIFTIGLASYNFGRFSQNM